MENMNLMLRDRLKVTTQPSDLTREAKGTTNHMASGSDITKSYLKY